MTNDLPQLIDDSVDADKDTHDGWVKIYRSLRRRAFAKNPLYRSLFIELMLLANHRTHTFYVNGRKITLLPGHIVTGRQQLSADTGIKQSTIERGLKRLVDEGVIEQKTTARCRIISIVNWESYQQGEHETDANRTTSGQLADTPRTLNKNVKNVKNVRSKKGTLTPQEILDRLEIPTPFDTEEVREALGEWLEHKSVRREPYRGTSPLKSLLTTATKSKATPDYLVFAIHYSISKNWQGVGFYKEVWEQFAGHGQGFQITPSTKKTIWDEKYEAEFGDQ